MNALKPAMGKEVHITERTDGKTPAEACGIEVEGKNKWLTLIQNASTKKDGF